LGFDELDQILGAELVQFDAEALLVRLAIRLRNRTAVAEPLQFNLVELQAFWQPLLANDSLDTQLVGGVVALVPAQHLLDRQAQAATTE
jgi:hypothetical protein